MGKDGRSAAEDSATELTLPILVATICILIVYLPIMFFHGHRQVSLRPARHDRRLCHAGGLCRLHVRDPRGARTALLSRGHGNGSDEDGSAAEGWFRFVLAIYEPAAADRPFASKSLVIAGALLALVGTGVLLIPRLHTEFFPKIDAGNFTMTVSAPEGSRIEKTTAIVAEIEKLVQETIPKQDLEEVISNTGLYLRRRSPLCSEYRQPHRLRAGEPCDRSRGHDERLHGLAADKISAIAARR